MGCKACEIEHLWAIPKEMQCVLLQQPVTIQSNIFGQDTTWAKLQIAHTA